jgi:beta-lactamase regulating signal transducer with metallopeptidase domain
MRGALPELWVLHACLGGGLLLLVAWVWQCGLRSAARRQRLGEWAVLAALLLPLLGLGPVWLPVVLPAQWFPSASSGVERPDQPAARGVDKQAPAAEVTRESPIDPEPDWAEALADVEESPQVESTPEESRAAPADRASAVEAVPSLPGRFELAAGTLVRVLVIGYALAAGLILARWLVGHAVLWWMLRQTEPVSEELSRLFEELAGGLRQPRLLVSDRVRVPFSFGLFRPTVVLPAGLAREAPLPVLRWVLAHELTHLARHDSWGCLLFGLGQGVYFFLPWFWWLRRQARLSQEYIADAAAVAAGAPVEDYAQFLLNWTAAPALPAGVTGVLGTRSDLFRRITMLLESKTPVEPHCSRRWSLIALCGLLSLAILVGGVRLQLGAAPAPPVKEADKKDDKKDKEKPADDKKADDKKADDKKADRKRAAPGGFPDIEEMLKRLPAGADPRIAEELRKQLEEMNKQMERMLRRGALPGRLPGGTPKEIQDELEAVRKALEEAMRRAGRRPLIVPPLIAPGLPRGIRPFPGREDTVREGRLGAQVTVPSATLIEQLDLPKGQGLVLEEVGPNSPAARAGLKAHDILLEVNGKSVPSKVDEFRKQLAEIKAKTPVDAVVLRKGKKETVKGLTLPEAEPAVAPGRRGENRLAPLPRRGVVPRNVPPAARAGVTIRSTQTGDEFTTIRTDANSTITVTGTVKGREKTIKEIRIKAGGKTTTYDSVDKVPAEYRDIVKQLVPASPARGRRLEL